ncbi:hypothetical protein ACROYT_G044058 [Oculina patagonica]
MEPQMEGEDLNDGRNTAASLRSGPNSESGTRPPSSSAKHQMYQSRSAVKVAWEKNEEDSDRLDEPVAVAGKARRGGVKVQDKDVRSSGSMRERSKSGNATGGNEMGTSPGVKARPRSSGVDVHQYLDGDKYYRLIGNGFYLAIFARFKVFRRNFTNILIASLAVVDCLQALFNVPLFTLFFVVEPSWLKGKAWAIISYSLRLEFGFLNLVSMTALMVDRFFAVHLPLKYFTWKTTKKAKIAVFLIWLVCTIVVVLLAVPLFNMDLDGMPVETNWLKGKAWAIISYSLRLEFGFLNLVSMTALMADRFFAVHLPLKYFTWKTTKKAKIAVFLMWLVCTIVVVLLAVPLFNMDLDGMPVGTSRKVIYEKERLIVGPIIVLFTIASTVLGILTCYSIYQKKKERMLLNLPPLCAEARLKKDIKAAKTVSMTIALYYICYIPLVVFSIWRRNDETKIINAWSAFTVSFLVFLSSTLNPIIYVLRYRRTRSAFRQFLKDPCGTSAYRENPVRKARRREKKPQIEGEELKDGRDTRASVRPGSNPENTKENKAMQREMEPQMEGEEDGRKTAASLTPGPNPQSDTRPPASSAKHQIYQSCGVVKVAWKENEEDRSRLDEQVAVARQARRDSEKVQDECVRSSGSMRERSNSVNAAEGKEMETSSEVEVRPRRTSVP